MGVLTYLTNRREYSSAEGFAGRPVIIAATHDIELVALAQRKYKICHFEGIVTKEGLCFDYILRPGPSESRNAIALLDSLGAPAELVQEARASAKELESRKPD
jgi:DNA mismatch repair ATPase MutS